MPFIPKIDRAPANLKTTDMEQFYTRDVANEGVKLPLKTKDGLNSEHRIFGMASTQISSG